MNTKNLLTFKTILEYGSFQKAADMLGYTQSTVTFQIKQLEEELSTQLFEKIGRRMQPTQAGMTLLPYIDTILRTEEEMLNLGKSLADMTGSLRLVIPDSILIYRFQVLLREFKKAAPKVNLVLNSLPSDEIEQAILNGSADIGINCDKGSYPASIIHKQLSPFKTVLVASPDTDIELRDFITPNQKKALSMICNEPNSNYQRAINDYLDAKDIVLNPYMKMQSIEAVKRSVINNLGIAYIPTFAIRDELKSGALITLKTELDERLFTSVCVYHKNKWLSPQMKLLLTLLEMNPIGPDD